MIKKKTEKYPFEYLQNPNPKKTKEEMWDILDGYTCETYYEKESQKHEIDFRIPLPPLKYKGKMIKGLFFSQTVDVLVEQFPKIKELFFPIANSMWSGYPQSEYADYYFVCYKNPSRERRWKKKHPDKKDVILLPLQDADWTNEYEYAPVFNAQKDIDVICVSTSYPFKNMPMLASVLKVYEQKYKTRLKAKCFLGMKEVVKLQDGNIDYSNAREDVQEQLNKVYEILGKAHEYIDFCPWINRSELSRFYSCSKCCVLCSLIEGKNRAIQEAQSCNTPIVLFKDHNKFAKGEYPLIYKGSGEFANEFSAECLAQTIHKVINNREKYTPRENYLKFNGRKNFINTIIDMSPYYRKNLPDYKKGRIQDNLWVDLAMQDNYQLSFIDFLYEKNPAIQYRKGIDDIKSLLDFFYSRFNISK